MNPTVIRITAALITAAFAGLAQAGPGSGDFTVVRQFDDPSRPTFSHGYLRGTIVLEHGRDED